jgi:hypothetical protein
LKYSIILADELDKKILDGEQAFYYLGCIQGMGFGYIYIFNSQTGEMVFGDYTKSDTGRIKSQDLKNIYYLVQKKLGN